MKPRYLLTLALSVALAGSCSSTGSARTAPGWKPVSPYFALEDWSLPQGQVEDLIAALPDASKGEWQGEPGTVGEGIGMVYHQGNRYSGTWQGGKLEGPFRVLRREMLLAEGMATKGEITDGTLYRHHYFHALYSSSWDQAHTDFIASQGGTHSLVAFRGAFKDGRPNSGRFYDAGSGYRNESFEDGTLTDDGRWDGHYAHYTSGRPAYDQLDELDEDYDLKEQGLYANGQREGRWTGGGIDFLYKDGQKHGVCRERSGTAFYNEHLTEGTEFFFGWKTTTYEDGQATGFQRIVFDKGPFDWVEYQGSGDGNQINPYGWHLIQPREGAPFLLAVANSLSVALDSIRPLPEGTTRSAMAAHSAILDLGDGVTWFGPVEDGKPNGFGRRFGFRPLITFEEGWFQDGEPQGYVLGTAPKIGKGSPLAYAWVDGVELDDQSGFHTHTLKDIENFELEQEQLAAMVKQHAFKYRPASERVWRALVWEGKVINPEGVVIEPRVVTGPDALSPGDIIWVKQQVMDTHRSFQVVASVDTYGYVYFRGLSERALYLDDSKIDVYSYSNTGSAFSGLAPACTYCDGTGSRVVVSTIQYKENRLEWVPGTGLLDTTYLVTERTPGLADCESCSGSGVILNRYFGQ